jgi:uncharacterized protein YvpB
MKKLLVSFIVICLTFFNTPHIDAQKLINWITSINETDPLLKPKKLGLSVMEPIILQRKIIDVPLIKQMDQPQLKNGCEVTSLAMLLNFHGINVTKNQLANEIHRVPIKDQNSKMGNPNIGFVGDMENGPGYSVYNGPIYDLAKKYAGRSVVNLTNSTFLDLLKKVSKGYPVWVITTNNFKPGAVFKRWETIQGPVNVTLSEHSAVITGYDENYIYVNDPYGYKNRKVDRVSFISAWEEMGKQAIVIEN